MATTTALIVGVVLGELIKVAQGIKDIFKYKVIHSNLATNFYLVAYPREPPIIKGKELDEAIGLPTKAVLQNTTCWTKIEIQGTMTINELIAKIDKDYNVTVEDIYVGNFQIFTRFSRMAKVLKGTFQ